MLELLEQRGTATACPSEVARRIGGTDWRAEMPRVREVAARLQAAGRIDVYQHGRPVDTSTARGAIRLRACNVGAIDYRAHPERYVVGRGEQGVLTVEPYKSELLPLWRFKTPSIARDSARSLYAKFVDYGNAGDFVGMDMARKFLQMGWTRARRYANHPSGRKYSAGRRELPRVEDATKAEAAAIFRQYYERAQNNRTYLRLSREAASRRATGDHATPRAHARPHRPARSGSSAGSPSSRASRSTRARTARIRR